MTLAINKHPILMSLENEGSRLLTGFVPTTTRCEQQVVMDELKLSSIQVLFAVDDHVLICFAQQLVNLREEVFSDYCTIANSNQEHLGVLGKLTRCWFVFFGDLLSQNTRFQSIIQREFPNAKRHFF